LIRKSLPQNFVVPAQSRRSRWVRVGPPAAAPHAVKLVDSPDHDREQGYEGELCGTQCRGAEHGLQWWEVDERGGEYQFERDADKEQPVRR
jgi:hypothetical protein